MLNCSVGISETADMAATSAVRENGKTPVGIESNEEINRPTVDKLCRVARKGHERHPKPEENRSEERSRNADGAEFGSGSTAWEHKLIAFVQVAEARREQLLWRAQRITKNREEAEDIVQEALLKGFKHLSQFRGESMMCTWLTAIVRNVGLEWLRGQGGRAILPLEQDQDGYEMPFLDNLQDPSEDPEQSCERWEIRNLLLTHIDELDSVSKHALRMCAIEERSHLEAANALGVIVAAIKSRLFHGKRMLKRAIHMRTGG